MLKPLRAALGLLLRATALLLLHASDGHATDVRMSDGETRARASNCFSCHALEHELVGPAYADIAKRYAGQGDAIVATLVRKVRMGGAGNWGDVRMTAHPELGGADITSMVKWILSLNPAASTASKSGASPAAAMNTYKDIFGKRVQTDVAVFAGADQATVTPAVSNGYEHYNAYCSRCHGGDAVGAGYAPDLRRSMAHGLTYEQFLSTAMTGRPDKGMPAWAKVFGEKDIRAIYDYIEARQLDLIPRGRPSSD